jgi:hypothetical protein
MRWKCRNAKAEDWSEQMTECWASFQQAIDHLAQERWAFASTLQTSIVPGAKAFATQQEIQVQRLVAGSWHDALFLEACNGT